MCTRCARWIERRWREPATVAVPSQRINAEWPELDTPTPEMMSRSLWWLEGEQHDAGAVAVARALVAATIPWRLLGATLLLAPVAWMASPLYAFVARHRHRLPGSSDSCRITR